MLETKALLTKDKTGTVLLSLSFSFFLTPGSDQDGVKHLTREWGCLWKSDLHRCFLCYCCEGDIELHRALALAEERAHGHLTQKSSNHPSEALLIPQGRASVQCRTDGDSTSQAQIHRGTRSLLVSRTLGNSWTGGQEQPLMASHLL